VKSSDAKHRTRHISILAFNFHSCAHFNAA
jgi:hypothetical protein